MNKYRELVVEAGKKMSARGLTVETWGNISVLDIKNEIMYITPSGMEYDTLLPEDIVAIDMQGNAVEGNRKPSIETGLHLAIYRARPDVLAVMHTHPIYSTVFSSIGEDIPVIHDEGAQALGGDVVRTAQYALPGSTELAENCVKALGDEAYACLLKSHGAVCVGASLQDCFKTATVLEMMAKIYQLIRATGKPYEPISKENIAIMRDFARNKYGQR